MSFNIYDRIKYFDKPFSYVVMNNQVEKFCSYCLRNPQKKLQICSQCHFARYCDKKCQKLGWRDHKPECRRLKVVFPNLPASEVFFLARVIDKLKFIAEKGDVHDWQKERKFDELMSHAEEIRANPEKMKHYEKMYEKTKKFLGDEMPDKESAFMTCCRTWINSHSIHTNAGTEIGIALDLGVSKYDHCCRPNMTLVFDGFRAMMRPLTPEVDANNPRTAFIAYVDIGRSKYQRRNDLYNKWYFWCQCERCVDPDDDRLTSMKCSNSTCPEPIIITEDSEPCDITCKSCGNLVTKEKVVEAQSLMKSLPTKYAFKDDEAEVQLVKENMAKVESLLHPENIYYCRLQTAYLQMSGGKELAMQPEVQKKVYQNYKRCLPKADRHIGYQLLHLVKALIEKGQRNEATQYAYEAMVIFEICFGLEHPYYLQTLALWTFLDTKADKTDGELMKLMNFNYNRPVDISSYLENTTIPVS